MNKFLPATVPVQVINNPGDFATPASTTLDPNPVVAELKPAGPPPKAARAKSTAAEGVQAATARGRLALPRAPEPLIPSVRTHSTEHVLQDTSARGRIVSAPQPA